MRSSTFYRRYRFFLGSRPGLAAYLRRVYRACEEDFSRLGLRPRLGRVLLCGTSGETTSTAFAAHVLSRNPEARITILDLGQPQVRSSRQAISRLLPGARVDYLVADATRMPLRDGSFDLVDTDFLLIYLSPERLRALFSEWRRILADGGALSFRALLTRSPASRAGSRLMNAWCRHALGAPGYSHSAREVESLLRDNGFQYLVAGRAFLPMGYRVVARKLPGGRPAPQVTGHPHRQGAGLAPAPGT